MKTYNSISCLLLLAISFVSLQAQTQIHLPAIDLGVYHGSEKWIEFNSTARTTVSSFWNQHGKAMGLGKNDQMMLLKTETDKLNWTHHRFQQLHSGIPVEFAVFKLHEREGVAVKGNGEIMKDIEVNAVPMVSRDQAFDIALQHIGAQTYNWEVPTLEERKRHATDDPSATFYPEGELLIVDEDFDQRNQSSYRLAWKFEVYAFQPQSTRWIYIDAHHGSILKELNMDIHTGYPGMAETRYSGEREIITDSTVVGYVLKDATRGKGVETYDALNRNNPDFVLNFFDPDNHWANANSRANDAATDAHWATELYYDYLRDRHGIDSYNNQGSKLVCYVHVGQNWYNARWTGFWSEYGDAGGEPWTFIDVVGHEFTHGFTWATAGLIYSMESGALNESFSDIIGEALQRYGHGGIHDWILTPAPVDTIRSMINPNDYENPDTYHGEYWEFGEFDNYGVHINSGVQNHWFYLLTEGGKGTNDNGDAFDVEPIGFEKAMDVVIRNMTAYLFPTSDYFDARQGSLQAAEDIFGQCSFEYQQVANAWHAVGVGERVDAEDFTVLDIAEMPLCTVDPSSTVTLHLKYLGCDSSGPITLYLTLVKSNPVLIIKDTLELPEGVGPGEAFDYVFSNNINFSRKGEHILTATVTSDNDLNKGNDDSKATPVHHLSQVSQQNFVFHNRIAARTFRDSMAFYVGEFADLDIAFNVGKDSTYGIRIEGDQMRHAKPILDGQDLFDLNERLGAQVCFCVNATELDSLKLQFDLRQTYSSRFELNAGFEQPKSSAMRILIDDIELARYFPETNNADDWQTHTHDLEAYLGSEFVLCFETRTIQSLEDDRDDIGDRVFLDNIEFIVEEVSSTSNIQSAESLMVYPNPAGDMFFVDIPSLEYSKALIMLRDSQGKLISSQEMSLASGGSQARINMMSVEPGIYFVELKTAGETMIGKVVRQ